MEFKKYHKKYSYLDYEFKAISTMINEMEIIYYTLSDCNENTEGVKTHKSFDYYGIGKRNVI